MKIIKQILASVGVTGREKAAPPHRGRADKLMRYLYKTHNEGSVQPCLSGSGRESSTPDPAVLQAYLEFVPRWNREFAERMRSDPEGAIALLFQVRGTQRNAYPYEFFSSGHTDKSLPGIFPSTPRHYLLKTVFRSFRLLFEKIARKELKGKGGAA